MEKNLNIPDFLEEKEDEIHTRMLQRAPDDVSTLEGDFYWDTTKPTADVASEQQMKLINVLKLAFPQTSYGECLEWLGELKGVFKNPATKATGVLAITGTEGTVIEKGKVVSTPMGDDIVGIEFEILETKTIDSSETVEVKAECITAGIIGNVKENSITVLATPVNGVKSISNKAFEGGTDIEDEEHYRERVIVAEQEDRLSGSNSDYERWAKEVKGVGFAYVLEEWNGPGTVKVLILDKNRNAATQELIETVQKYIYPKVLESDNRDGKAPLGAIVTIDTPSTLLVNVKASFVFAEGYSEETVLTNLKNKIDKYLDEIDIGGIVNYNAIHTIIGSMMLADEGIKDYSNLTINDVKENIVLNDQVVGIGEVINIA